jgi:hypothetical protein
VHRQRSAGQRHFVIVEELRELAGPMDLLELRGQHRKPSGHFTGADQQADLERRLQRRTDQTGIGGT